jgi:hypothetical protein
VGLRGLVPGRRGVDRDDVARWRRVYEYGASFFVRRRWSDGGAEGVRAQAETVAVVPFCVVDNIRFLYRTAIPARGFFGSRARAPEGSPHPLQNCASADESYRQCGYVMMRETQAPRIDSNRSEGHFGSQMVIPVWYSR